jgi:hypothetical protein
VTFAHPGGADHEGISAFFEVASGGEFIDFLFVDLGIKTPVKAVESPDFSEACGLDATVSLAILSDHLFILEDEFEELQMAQPRGGCLLEANG